MWTLWYLVGYFYIYIRTMNYDYVYPLYSNHDTSTFAPLNVSLSRKRGTPISMFIAAQDDDSWQQVAPHAMWA
jgi:hypothetical protein